MTFSRDAKNRWRFRALDHAHHTAIRARLAEAGLTEIGHPWMLGLLWRSGTGEVPSQRVLADRIGISPAAVANSLKSLELRGLVRREADEHDGRRNRVTITEEGRAAVRRCQSVFLEVDEAMYAGFSDAELRELDGYLARMMENLRRIGGRAPDFDRAGEETSE
ncbi:MAG TPA: MarR family winged helix-turn-helix transcriptional regulator [Oscillospiraceae bacterium]|nr:MarR family winged helix-turn-helix transcriptional regulator [Oscillospiraceae bacterium]